MATRTLRFGRVTLGLKEVGKPLQSIQAQVPGNGLRCAHGGASATGLDLTGLESHTLHMSHRFGVGRVEHFQKAGAQTPPIYPRINFSIGLGPPPGQKPQRAPQVPVSDAVPQQPDPPPVCKPLPVPSHTSPASCLWQLHHISGCFRLVMLSKAILVVGASLAFFGLTQLTLRRTLHLACSHSAIILFKPFCKHNISYVA